MLQRIQSIFLLLAAAANAALFAPQLSFATASPDAAISNIMSDGAYNIYDHVALLVLTALGAALALGTIFLFKNRQLQTRLCYLLAAITIALLGTAFALMSQAAIPNLQYKFAWAAPLVAFVFGLLAAWAIGRDEKLVRSMDRLR